MTKLRLQFIDLSLIVFFNSVSGEEMSWVSLVPESVLFGSVIADCVEMLSSGGESMIFPFLSLVPCYRLIQRVKVEVERRLDSVLICGCLF